MQKKEIKHSRHKEEHTYGELCRAIFQMKVDIAEFTYRPLTQESIGQLPQMIRLANETMIGEMGFDASIDEEFRLLATTHNSLQTKVEESLYYHALEGAVPDQLLDTQVNSNS